MKIKIWDANNGAERLTLSGHDSEVYAISWSPGGQYVASSGSGGEVKVWDTSNGQEMTSVSGDSSAMHVIAWSPNDLYIATGGFTGEVKIWEALAWEPHRKL